MKTYYNRLSSEEKKSLKKNIKNSKFNDLYKKVNYYLFLTYGCFFLVIADVYFRYYFNGKTIDYIVDAIIIIGLLIHLETLFVLPLLILVLLTQMINFHIFMTITV